MLTNDFIISIPSSSGRRLFISASRFRMNIALTSSRFIPITVSVAHIIDILISADTLPLDADLDLG